jgi:predicted Zn-dependent protease
LRTSKYYPGGITFFFDKIREEQKRKGETPGDLDRMLSTHPLPEDRIRDANTILNQISPRPDPAKGLFIEEYQQMKQKLP